MARLCLYLKVKVCKNIFEDITGQILGAHLVGVEVTELINSFSLAMKLEATELDIFYNFSYPTISESIHDLH